MSNKIFISYRRADSADVSGRLYDRFIERYGSNNVFKDVDSIPFGEDFRMTITATLGECAVVLIVIGKEWLNIMGTNGMRRLDDPDDPVRIEIETALLSGARVVPILVQGASIPKQEELPTSLQQLQWQNATLVRGDPDFHRDVDRLISVLEPVLATPKTEEVFYREKAILMIGHSEFLHWWPLWIIGTIVGGFRFFGHVERFELDLLYFSVAGLLVIVTTCSLPSVYSTWLLIVLAIFSYLCYSADPALFAILSKHVHVSGELYLVSSLIIFLLWFGVFRFVDPRSTYIEISKYRIRVKDSFNNETSFSPSVILFRIRKRDIWRHHLLAFGSGDLVIQAAERGRGLREYRINNLLFINAKSYGLESIFSHTVNLND